MSDVAGASAPIAVHHLAGEGSRPPLLISHATGFHGHAYLPLAHGLAATFDVHAIDHRGHGHTALRADTVIDWADCGADTATVASALAPDGGLVGFGHSMGGATLLWAARADPRRFSMLVLFEPIVFPDPPEGAPLDNPLADGALRRRRTFESYDAAYERFASRPPLGSFDPAALRAYVDFGFAPDRDGVSLRCTPEVESATFRAANTSGLWPTLGEIDVPTVVIGSGDGQPPAEIARLIAGRLSAATFVYLPELDHFGPFTHPAVVAEAIVEHAAPTR